MRKLLFGLTLIIAGLYLILFVLFFIIMNFQSVLTVEEPVAIVKPLYVNQGIILTYEISPKRDFEEPKYKFIRLPSQKEQFIVNATIIELHPIFYFFGARPLYRVNSVSGYHLHKTRLPRFLHNNLEKLPGIRAVYDNQVIKKIKRNTYYGIYATATTLSVKSMSVY